MLTKNAFQLLMIGFQIKLKMLILIILTLKTIYYV